MFSPPNQQMAVQARLLNVQIPSSTSFDSSYVAMDALSQAESLVHSSKKLEDELVMLGQIIKHHEENIKHLKTCINSLDDQITDTQVRNHLSMAPMIEDEDATVKHIMQHEKTAASIICQLKYQGSHADCTNDVLGVVATLGNVNEDNLSMIISEYLGVDTMLALVCKTYKGVEALETYDKQGSVDKSSGLYGLGRTINGRFNVICLEHLRAYDGEFIPDDPQRRLALIKPKLPNGESPEGFLGFAVNMIHLKTDELGLRETLFYNLLWQLQVYKTRAHMLQALPFLSDGAVSLDGHIIRKNGVFVFGTWDGSDVRFARSSCLPENENLVEIEKQMEELKQEKETRVEELQREEAILAHVKYTFEVKKQEFVRFMAQTSTYALQFPVQATPTPRRSTPTPR